MNQEPIIHWDSAWGWPALALLVGAIALIAWSYRSPKPPGRLHHGALVFKVLGMAALALCLIEPKRSEWTIRTGANLVLTLTDDSQSMDLRDDEGGATRGELTRTTLDPNALWRTDLERTFSTRHYAFHSRLRSLASPEDLAFDGTRSSLETSLQTLVERFRDRPVSGVLLFTDGNATDSLDEAFPWDDLPPIYPVRLSEGQPKRDLALGLVTVTETNFEETPATVQAEVHARGYEDRELLFELKDESGQTLASQIAPCSQEDETISVRLKWQPKIGEVQFPVLSVREHDEPLGEGEVTAANNRRWLKIDRGGGPYRILYVSGRPNWEFKFLRRALEEDREVDLVGLIRIARKEPRFAFRDAALGTRSQLFKGFETDTDEGAEAYDEPVLLRMGTLDEFELREGFPKKAEDLFRYHAVILDDLEATFFTPDQQTLLREFVSQRGGGLLFLGGQESFTRGGYEHTPLEDLLPVYLQSDESPVEDIGHRVRLTREGWLAPWIRLRSNEEAEHLRLEEMPPFRTVNSVGRIKPGASELLHTVDGGDHIRPGLVTQRFGPGRTGALMIGDLWRWDLARRDAEKSDLGRAWRQSVRWLVAEVPERIGVDISRESPESQEVRLAISVRNAEYRPQLDARPKIALTLPDGSKLDLNPAPADDEVGLWVTEYGPRLEGAYRVQVTVEEPDGSLLGNLDSGFVHDPASEEFRRIPNDLERLETLAKRSGGELLSPDDLSSFVATLGRQDQPEMERRISPLWHQWWVLVFALACFCLEWALRRVRGLP